VQALALSCVANVGGREFAETLLPDVQKILLSSRSRPQVIGPVRLGAVLALAKAEASPRPSRPACAARVMVASRHLCPPCSCSDQCFTGCDQAKKKAALCMLRLLRKYPEARLPLSPRVPPDATC
jgi:hypothetical protein